MSDQEILNQIRQYVVSVLNNEPSVYAICEHERQYVEGRESVAEAIHDILKQQV